MVEIELHANSMYSKCNPMLAPYPFSFSSVMHQRYFGKDIDPVCHRQCCFNLLGTEDLPGSKNPRLQCVFAISMKLWFSSKSSIHRKWLSSIIASWNSSKRCNDNPRVSSVLLRWPASDANMGFDNGLFTGTRVGSTWTSAQMVCGGDVPPVPLSSPDTTWPDNSKSYYGYVGTRATLPKLYQTACPLQG